MEDALYIIKKNYYAADRSFMFYLHERDRFCRKEYNKLVNCINELTENCEFSRETGEMIRWVQLQTVLHLTYHFDSSDGYRIKNLPDDIWEILEDLRCAADVYFSKFVKIKD